MSGQRWTWSLILSGGILFLFGAVYPIEGFPLVLVGLAAVYFGQRRVGGRYTRALRLELLAAAAGIVAMLVITFMGGTGGESELSMWWLLTVLPYPAGILSGTVTITLALLEMRRRELHAEARAASRAGAGADHGTLS